MSFLSAPRPPKRIAAGRALLASLLVIVLASCGGAVEGRPLEGSASTTATAEPTSAQPVEPSDAEDPSSSASGPGGTGSAASDSPTATGSADAQEDGPSAGGDGASTTIAPPPTEARSIDISRYSHTGPFLFEYGDGFADSGPTTFREVWGDPIELSMQRHVPGEDVQDEEWAFGWDEDGTFIVGLAEIRTPASGLEPERVWYALVRVDPSAPSETVQRIDLEIPGWDLRLITAAPGAMVVLDYGREDNRSEKTVIGVRLSEDGGVTWTIDDERQLLWQDLSWRGVEPPSAVTGLFEQGTGWGCQDEANLVAIDLATGEEKWREQYTIGDGVCLLRERTEVPGGAWVALEETMDPAAGDGMGEGRRFVRSLATGERQEIAAFVNRFTIVENDGTLAWVELPSWAGGGQEPGEGIIDLETGETHFRLTEEEISDLDLEVRSIHDGILYVSTTDEDIALDARTGEELGTWTEYPVDMIAGDVVLSDGRAYQAPWKYGE